MKVRASVKKCVQTVKLLKEKELLELSAKILNINKDKGNWLKLPYYKE